MWKWSCSWQPEASGGACNLRHLYILITAVPITTTPSHSTQACASRFDDFFKTPILISAAYPKRWSIALPTCAFTRQVAPGTKWVVRSVPMKQQPDSCVRQTQSGKRKNKAPDIEICRYAMSLRSRNWVRAEAPPSRRIRPCAEHRSIPPRSSTSKSTFLDKRDPANPIAFLICLQRPQ